MSSPVSPGAGDLRSERAGVRQLGSGTRDCGLSPQRIFWAGRTRPQVPAALMPETLTLGIRGRCRPSGQEWHYSRHQEPPESPKGPKGQSTGGSAGAAGALWAPVVTWGARRGPPTYRALHALLSPAVLADDVLPVTDDRGADPGHVQWTPSGPLPEQPRGPPDGHHQRHGGSWGSGLPPGVSEGSVLPSAFGSRSVPLFQVIPNYSSRAEYEKLFAMGVTM